MEQTWFDTARFGMFVHWGHCSQRGIELSWPLVGGLFALPYCSSMGVDEYHATAATFDPKAWDARELARAAKRMGMQYAIITAKHHDGYAMYHTKQSDYSIEHSPFGRDIVREFIEAMRGEGLRVGVYFSLIDWHHPDYPAFTEADKPYDFFAQARKLDPAKWERFTEFMFAQVRELLTDYGKIDVIWFDGGWERTAQKWKGAGAGEHDPLAAAGHPDQRPAPGTGDYATPEQFVPAQAPARALGNLHDDQRELGLQHRRRPLEVARASSSTRSARWRGAAATCCSTSGRWATGGCSPKSRSGSRGRRRGWRATARASSARRRGWSRGSATGRRRARAIASTCTC